MYSGSSICTYYIRANHRGHAFNAYLVSILWDFKYIVGFPNRIPWLYAHSRDVDEKSNKESGNYCSIREPPGETDTVASI